MNCDTSAPALASACAKKVAGVLLHQAVRPGLVRALARAVNRGAIRRPLERPAKSWHAGPKVVSPHGLKPVSRLNRPRWRLPMCALRCGSSNGCLCAGRTGSFGRRPQHQFATSLSGRSFDRRELARQQRPSSLPLSFP